MNLNDPKILTARLDHAASIWFAAMSNTAGNEVFRAQLQLAKAMRSGDATAQEKAEQRVWISETRLTSLRALEGQSIMYFRLFLKAHGLPQTTFDDEHPTRKQNP